ncbi:MAG: hypothetical protein ACYDH6_02035 [Acidimicrobiales bacterium]
MMGRTAVAVAATLVALAFALSTFERWLLRRRRQDLAWSGALVLFAVAAAALTAGAGLGWDGPTFRVFYLFGAILNVPFLALGTVYLLAGPRTGDRVAIAVSIAGAFAVGVVMSAPFRTAIPAGRLVQGSAVFGALPRVLAGVASAGGAAVILAGAVWSMVHRRGVLPNGLIAAGTLVLGASGVFNSVFDEMSAFAVSLLIGITLVFVGFLTSAGQRSARRSSLPVAGECGSASTNMTLLGHL